MRKKIYENIYELDERERPQVRGNQNHENIPDELKNSARFCCWFFAWDDLGKRVTKIPVTPSTGRWAKVNLEETFESYDKAEKHYLSDKKANGCMKYDGIGIRVSDGITALDFDDCISNGIIDGSIMELIEHFHTYSEISPSGKGVRLVCMTKDLHFSEAEFKEKYYINHPLKNTEFKFRREVYVAGTTKKFCTLTGNEIAEGCGTLGERTAELMEFLDKYMLKPKYEINTVNNTPYTPSPEDHLTDEEVIQHLLTAQNSEVTNRLWNGDCSDFLHKDGAKAGEQNHSAGDAALCTRIAFYADSRDQVDRVFRESGMYREKWERDDYRDLTIDYAISNCKGHYSKSYRSEQPSVNSSFGDMVFTDIVDGESSADSATPPCSNPKDPIADLNEIKEALLRQSNFYKFDEFEAQVNDPDNIPWPTGLKALDEKLGGGIFPEFVIIGAPPSMGKSALVEQIADNFARDGHDVFYYSYEMSRNQLMARSISRIGYLEDLRRHGNHNLSKDFRNISCGYLRDDFTDAERELISWAEDEYKEKYARHLFVMDGSNSSVETIEKNVELWKNTFGIAPTVIVDYLQICPHAESAKLSTDKMVLDYVVSTLQKLQRKYKNRVILISSLNRAGSSKQEMQSFSGSSGIEYSADSLLSLYDWTTEDEKIYKTPEEIKRLYNGCKEHGYAYGMHIALVKQRFGVRGARADIAANLKYSCFMDSREIDRPSDAEKRLWES